VCNNHPCSVPKLRVSPAHVPWNHPWNLVNRLGAQCSRKVVKRSKVARPPAQLERACSYNFHQGWVGIVVAHSLVTDCCAQENKRVHGQITPVCDNNKARWGFFFKPNRRREKATFFSESSFVEGIFLHRSLFFVRLPNATDLSLPPQLCSSSLCLSHSCSTRSAASLAQTPIIHQLASTHSCISTSLSAVLRPFPKALFHNSSIHHAYYSRSSTRR